MKSPNGLHDYVTSRFLRVCSITLVSRIIDYFVFHLTGSRKFSKCHTEQSAQRCRSSLSGTFRNSLSPTLASERISIGTELRLILKGFPSCVFLLRARLNVLHEGAVKPPSQRE